MADVFEQRAELSSARERLWELIAQTPALDWLLLTKRPEHISRLAPWSENWPKNVWVGVTAENQQWAARRIPILLQVPAILRFVSCEPLLGSVDLARWVQGKRRIDWVIAGGESGHKARPMNPEWARKLRDQCRAAAVPFHFKQWGHWRPDNVDVSRTRTRLRMEIQGHTVTLVRLGKHAAGRDLDGRIWDEFPAGQPQRVAAR